MTWGHARAVAVAKFDAGGVADVDRLRRDHPRRNSEKFFQIRNEAFIRPQSPAFLSMKL